MTSRLSTFGRAFLDAFLGRAPSPTPADLSAQSWWRDFVSALAGRTGMAADAARTTPSVGRLLWASGKIATLEAAAQHAAGSRLVHAQDATVTATMILNLGPVLNALQPTKDAVIRAGAVLIVKVDWVVVVHQLTAAQQLRLDHEPELAQSPRDILAALRPPDDSSTQTAVLDSPPSSRTPHSMESNPEPSQDHGK